MQVYDIILMWWKILGRKFMVQGSFCAYMGKRDAPKVSALIDNI